MNVESTGIRRIALALEQDAMPEAAARLALRLAQGLGAELSGILVEDSDLIRAAGIPFAREILHADGDADQELDADALMRQLQLRASRLRQQLEARARDSGVRVRFSTLRGPGVRALLGMQDVGDLIVIGHAPSSRWKEIVTGSGLLVAQPSAGEARQTADRLASLVRTLSAGTPDTRLRWTDADALVAACRRSRPACVVVPASMVPASELRSLARRLPCPLLLLTDR